MNEPEVRIEDGAEVTNERGLMRIVRWKTLPNWHLEMKFDCYGGNWEPVIGSGSPQLTKIKLLQVHIEMLLEEQRNRLTQDQPQLETAYA